MTLHAKQFTPVDKGLIPTGELKNVAGTPMDFNSATAIGKRINESDEQLVFGKGYDHNWVLARAGGGNGLSIAAEAYDPKSGRRLEVLRLSLECSSTAVIFWTAQKVRAISLTRKERLSAWRRSTFPILRIMRTFPARC